MEWESFSQNSSREQSVMAVAEKKFSALLLGKESDKRQPKMFCVTAPQEAHWRRLFNTDSYLFKRAKISLVMSVVGAFQMTARLRQTKASFLSSATCWMT